MDWITLPPSKFKSVDLPLPEGPISAKTSPGFTAPVIPCKMSFSSFDLIPFMTTLYVTSVNYPKKKKIPQLIKAKTCKKHFTLQYYQQNLGEYIYIFFSNASRNNPKKNLQDSLMMYQISIPFLPIPCLLVLFF